VKAISRSEYGFFASRLRPRLLFHRVAGFEAATILRSEPQHAALATLSIGPRFRVASVRPDGREQLSIDPIVRMGLPIGTEGIHLEARCGQAKLPDAGAFGSAASARQTATSQTRVSAARAPGVKDARKHWILAACANEWTASLAAMQHGARRRCGSISASSPA